ncbi:MAG: ATP-binding protein [Acidimicrobiia bacterium]|nr:ATP-binding protein [Acidimicrobiia bacterium]
MKRVIGCVPLLSSGLTWPQRRVTVNLAPSGIRKTGAGLDLPIAIALLIGNDELDAAAVEGMAFVGELGLDGSVRRVPGTVPLVEAISARTVVVPLDCGAEAALVGGPEVRGAATLTTLLACLKGEENWPPLPKPCPPPLPPPPDMADVRGQDVGRAAVEVAAAGGHHLLLSGPSDPDQAALLEAMGWQAASLDQLVVRTGLTPGQASVALAHLEMGGWVVGQAGWWEQVRREVSAK